MAKCICGDHFLRYSSNKGVGGIIGPFIDIALLTLGKILSWRVRIIIESSQLVGNIYEESGV